MPLYQDEVALRASRARFLIDGATNYGLFAQCASNTRAIAHIFQPFAYFYSTFDSAFGWAGIRAFPAAVVLTTLGIALTHTLARRRLDASLLLLAGFIGVAGSGLVLSRMEAPTLLFGAICMAGFLLVHRQGTPPVALAAYFVIAMFFALLALFIHPQAMVFVPILVLLAITSTTQCRRRWVNAIAWFSIVCAVAGSFAASNDLSVRCPESPAFQTQIDRLGLPGLAREQGLIGLQTNLSGKLNRYAGNFHFQRVYDVGYHPSIDPRSAMEATPLKFLNASISCAVWLNLLLACCLATGAATSIARNIPSIRCGSRKAFASALNSPAIYVFVVLSGHLTLLLYDTPTNF
jgi:ABC-type multidrug transport system fused ATPase/permease subunit